MIIRGVGEAWSFQQAALRVGRKSESAARSPESLRSWRPQSAWSAAESLANDRDQSFII